MGIESITKFNIDVPEIVNKFPVPSSTKRIAPPLEAELPTCTVSCKDPAVEPDE